MSAHSSDRLVLTELDGGVVRIALANPPRNTLDVPLMQQLTKSVRQLTSLPVAKRPKVILLASDVPHQFSSGIDPESILSADPAGRLAVFMALADLVESLWFGYVPIVADISGPALAGGAVLAATAEFAVIDTHAWKVPAIFRHIGDGGKIRVSPGFGTARREAERPEGLGRAVAQRHQPWGVAARQPLAEARETMGETGHAGDRVHAASWTEA